MALPEHFQHALTDMHTVSHDDSTDVYMSDSSLPVYNFDIIKNWYAKTLAEDGNQLDIKSNDALYIENDNIVFIEFKNGVIKNEIKQGLKRKIYDSFIILMDDITEAKYVIKDFKADAGFSRKNIDYILVYNEAKNPSSNKNKIRHGYIQKGGGEIPARFGLQYFEGFLFRKVRTYTVNEFKAKFLDRIGHTY